MTPSIIIEDQDTAFCWTVPQSKHIAQLLINATYTEAMVTSMGQQNRSYQQLIGSYEKAQGMLKNKINNLEMIAINHELTEASIKRRMISQDRKIKKGRWHKVGLSLLAGFFLFTTINQ